MFNPFTFEVFISSFLKLTHICFMILRCSPDHSVTWSVMSPAGGLGASGFHSVKLNTDLHLLCDPENTIPKTASEVLDVSVSGRIKNLRVNLTTPDDT